MDRIAIPKIEGYHCFGCGSRNPQGLNMSFYVAGDSVRSDLILNAHHVGWEGIAHGGIVSTILDEIMGWTVIAFKRVFFVTRSMEVRYLRPVPIDEPLTALGQLADGDGSGPGGCRVSGALLDGQGSRLAEARADMAYLSPKRLHMIPAQYRIEMERLFGEIGRLLDPSRG